MSGKLSKAFKWGASALRVAKVRFVAGSRIKIASGKPLYLGKNVRLILGEGSSLVVGSGVYLSPGCVIWVDDGASLVLEDGVFMNEGCRVTVAESVRVGDDTLFGPNVQVYDHDHEFNRGGGLFGAASCTDFHRAVLLALCQRGRHAWLCDCGPFARLGQLRCHSRPSRRGRAVRWRACKVD